jgi:hypothetical protein
MKKKATSRRKARPGASKAPKRRRKASVKGAAPAAPATIMISGIGRYKKSTCHKTKTDAQKSAEGKRAKGQKARVRKSGTGYCVYARGRAQ